MRTETMARVAATAAEAWLKRNPVSAPLLDDEREELAAAIHKAIHAAALRVEPRRAEAVAE